MRTTGARRAWGLGLALTLSCTACHAYDARVNSLPGRNPGTPPDASASRFINDGSVVFAIIRANMAAGRTPAALVPVSHPLAGYRVAYADVVSNLKETVQEGDNDQKLYQYTFDTSNGAWNVLTSTTRNAGSGTIDLPDADIMDWIAGSLVATSSAATGFPPGALTYEFRVTLKASSQGYTGTYRYLETRSGSEVLASSTDYDHVVEADGTPVVLRVNNQDTASGGSEVESGEIEGGDTYQETASKDPLTGDETKNGVFTDRTDGTTVPYEIHRTAATGLASAKGTLPGGVTLNVSYSPTWNLTGGELFDATGQRFGTLSMGSDRHMVLALSDGRTLKER